MKKTSHPLGQILTWQHASPEHAVTLNRGEVHLWAIPLHLTDEQSELAGTWLNDHQQEKLARRKSQAQKEVYLAGRYFLFCLLSHYASAQPKELPLAYSRLSKPYLSPNPSHLAFNFTDSKSADAATGLYAFYVGDTIGVDIENRSRRGKFSAIARRKFSAREQALVFNQDDSICEQQFLALWTRKEAYGKATGLGVNYKMNQLDLAGLRPGDHWLSFQGPQNQTSYQLLQFEVGPGLIASVVYAGTRRLGIKAFTPNPPVLKIDC